MDVPETCRTSLAIITGSHEPIELRREFDTTANVVQLTYGANKAVLTIGISAWRSNRLEDAGLTDLARDKFWVLILRKQVHKGMEHTILCKR